MGTRLSAQTSGLGEAFGKVKPILKRLRDPFEQEVLRWEGIWEQKSAFSDLPDETGPAQSRQVKHDLAHDLAILERLTETLTATRGMLQDCHGPLFESTDRYLLGRREAARLGSDRETLELYIDEIRKTRRIWGAGHDLIQRAGEWEPTVRLSASILGRAVEHVIQRRQVIWLQQHHDRAAARLAAVRAMGGIDPELVRLHTLTESIAGVPLPPLRPIVWVDTTATLTDPT